jgi:terminase small subunit / prophage DNA-packing protein
VTSIAKIRRDLLGDEIEPVAALQIVSAPQLAMLLGISPRMVTEHAKIGIVVRLEPGQYDLQKSVRGYCDHLRDKAQSDELMEQRIRQTREAADQLALKNAKSKSELLPAAEVENTWAGIMRDVRAGCLAITARVQQQLPHLSAHDAAMIDSEVRAALARLGESDA